MEMKPFDEAVSMSQDSMVSLTDMEGRIQWFSSNAKDLLPSFFGEHLVGRTGLEFGVVRDSPLGAFAQRVVTEKPAYLAEGAFFLFFFLFLPSFLSICPPPLSALFLSVHLFISVCVSFSPVRASVLVQRFFYVFVNASVIFLVLFLFSLFPSLSTCVCARAPARSSVLVIEYLCARSHRGVPLPHTHTHTQKSWSPTSSRASSGGWTSRRCGSTRWASCG